jgi:hypothetical protein
MQKKQQLKAIPNRKKQVIQTFLQYLIRRDVKLLQLKKLLLQKLSHITLPSLLFVHPIVISLIFPFPPS